MHQYKTVHIKDERYLYISDAHASSSNSLVNAANYNPTWIVSNR